MEKEFIENGSLRESSVLLDAHNLIVKFKCSENSIDILTEYLAERFEFEFEKKCGVSIKEALKAGIYNASML